MGDSSGGGKESPPQETNKNRARKAVFYSETDIGPFEVIVQSDEKSGIHIGNLHPMDLGKILVNLKIQNIKEIKRKGANRVGVSFHTAIAANEFAKNKDITEMGYEVFIPVSLITCRGLIRGVGKTITDEDILNNIDTKYKVVSVRRLNRRCVDGNEIKYLPTGTVLVTFEGKILPARIYIFHNKQEIYTYVKPVVLCYKCFRFGHTKTQCRGAPRCEKCGNKEHEITSCDKEKPICIQCNNEHLVTNKSCPEYNRQKKINEVMACDNISFFEAAKRYPKDSTDKERPNVHNEESLRLRNFPSLRPRAIQHELEEGISIRERRNNMYQSPNAQRQQKYSTVARGKKRKTIPTSPNYDVAAHSQCLFPSSSRTPNYSRLNTPTRANDVPIPSPLRLPLSSNRSPNNSQYNMPSISNRQEAFKAGNNKEASNELAEVLSNKPLTELEVIKLVKILLEKTPNLYSFFPSFATKSTNDNLDQSSDNMETSSQISQEYF